MRSPKEKLARTRGVYRPWVAFREEPLGSPVAVALGGLLDHHGGVVPSVLA